MENKIRLQTERRAKLQGTRGAAMSPEGSKLKTTIVELNDEKAPTKVNSHSSKNVCVSNIVHYAVKSLNNLDPKSSFEVPE